MSLRTQTSSRGRSAIVAVIAALTVLSPAATAVRAEGAGSAAPAYVTFMYAHTGELVNHDCTVDPQGVSLDTISQAFAVRGMAPTGTLVSSWVGQCLSGVPLQPVPKYIAVPSWSVLQGMTSTENWGFIPHSRTYPSVTTLPAASQQAEICGSKQDLEAQGMTGAGAMFAYPNNLSNPQTQIVVQSCGYRAGRKYAKGVNTRSTLSSSRYVGTHSVNGGWCNNPALECYSFQGPMVTYRYENIAALQASVAAVTSRQWLVVQFYRAITGSGPDGDCTSADWHDHWTVGTEYLCWNDMLSILDAVPSGARVVHPSDAERGLHLAPWA